MGIPRTKMENVSSNDLTRRVILWLCIACTVQCQNILDSKNLYTYLFVTNSYNYRLRPAIDQASAVDVHLAMNLLNINELNEVEETLKTTAFLSIGWVDQELRWNPDEFSGLQSLMVPQGEVWKPDIALKNSYVNYNALGVSSLNVLIDQYGNVSWYPYQKFQSTCSIDIRYFPFDTQTCEMEFAAWSYSQAEVAMKGFGYGEGIDLYQFEPSATWTLIDSSWRRNEDAYEPTVIFSLTLKRKALYIMLNVILPICLLAILDLFVFMLPCASGEKVGYAVTVFLAFAVFLTIIQSSLPANSDSVSLFSVYLLVLTIDSTLITVIALLIVKCSLLDDSISPVPTILVCLSNLGHFKLCGKVCKPCRKKNTSNKVSDVEKAKNDNGHDVDEDEECEATSSKDEPAIWADILGGLDIFCFLIFTMIYVVATFLFISWVAFY